MTSGAAFLFAILLAVNIGHLSEAAECQRLLVPAYFDDSASWQETFQQGENINQFRQFYTLSRFPLHLAVTSCRYHDIFRRSLLRNSRDQSR